jgi:hypothetical protein
MERVHAAAGVDPEVIRKRELQMQQRREKRLEKEREISQKRELRRRESDRRHWNPDGTKRKHPLPR